MKRQLGGDRGSVSSGLNLLGRDRDSQGSGLDSLGGQQGLMQEPASLEMGIAWSTDGATGAPVGGGGSGSGGEDDQADTAVVYGTSC